MRSAKIKVDLSALPTDSGARRKEYVKRYNAKWRELNPLYMTIYLRAYHAL